MGIFPSPRQTETNTGRHADRQIGGPRKRLAWLSPQLLVGALGVLLVAGCGTTPPPRQAKPIAVDVVTPITGDVTDYQDFTGRLNAIKTVDIRARVTGYVIDAPFKEGDRVTEGQVLFHIDTGSYLADLKLAKANLKLAEAQRAVQEKIANRAGKLAGTRSVPQEEYETILATLEKDQATVEAMRANRDKAQLYMDWTTVKAPFSGRISRRMVDPGNLVQADNTILTSLVTEDPLYTYFDVDERTYLNLTGTSGKGLSSWVQSMKFPVLMRLANEEEFTHKGEVNFIDNQVSSTTGTVKMRGEFKNEGGFLKPGLFARIRMPIGKPYKALLVPDETLMSDQGRKFVYVVNGKNEVEYRKMKIGQAVLARRPIPPSEPDKKAEAEPPQFEDIVLRVVYPPEAGKQGKEGLAPGERVIITNQQRVRPGAKVTIRIRPAPPQPESPFGKLLTAERVAE